MVQPERAPLNYSHALRGMAFFRTRQLEFMLQQIFGPEQSRT